MKAEENVFQCSHCQNHCAVSFVLQDGSIAHMQGILCPNGMMELLKELLYRRNCTVFRKEGNSICGNHVVESIRSV